jgi:peptidyl-prolyl cis-trans isomerase B (cyclophilin B)
MGWPQSAMKVLGLCVMAMGLCGCNKDASTDSPPASIGSQDSTAPASDRPSGSASATVAGDSAKRAPSFVLPVVVVETKLGTIKIRLRDDKSPRTVENFLENYVSRGFYDETIIHHVEKGFMIAAGGYTADLKPKATRAWIRNESNNGLSNKRGTVAMARHPDYAHSGTSQFFINIADNPSLDYRPPQTGEISDDAYGYCVFGEVIDGMDVVDRIAEVQVHSTELFPSVPQETVSIAAIRRID